MTERDQRTVLLFKSEAFNTSKRKPHFINEANYGDDVARWFIERLRALGVQTDDEPDQEDFGWYLNYTTADGTFILVITYRPDDPTGDWLCWIERDCSFLASLFGGRRKHIAEGAIGAISSAIQDVDQLHDARWYTRANFDAGERDPSPVA